MECGSGFSSSHRSGSSDRRARSVQGRRSVKGAEPPAFDLTPLLQQSEEQFGYNVVSRALDRSADAIRFLDTLFFALMAAQGAIYAIILDKIREYPRLDWELLLGGLVLAMIGSGFTLFVRDGPDPDAFAESFPDDPRGSRLQHIDEYTAKAKQNERLQIVKTIVLALSLAMTVVPLVIATTGRIDGVRIGVP
ncbi:MAG: hypothetical protein JWM87_1694 [Candidatus Eremiobacteraeota bacterium]|nr:hypothetical protein [Candidatus Eremiobacteraeota bacterium]